ncbi:hypothetical protein PG994_000759 [Apiospora phragmitis]|uniref:2EXR domain-containing protein n=1 Tax=Apiospora phragmitis TaxID=2905665 RepID=A0ABR1X764_9PEZI
MASSSGKGNGPVISFIGGREYQVAAKAKQASSSSLEQFTCFSKLPPEIRTQIWNLAVPERVMQLSPYAEVAGHRSGHLDFFNNYPCTPKNTRHHLALPPVAQVCREPHTAYRQIAKDVAWYQHVRNNQHHLHIRHNMALRPGMSKTRLEQTWFDPASDILCLDLWGQYRDDLAHCTIQIFPNELKLKVFAKSARAVAFSFGCGGMDSSDMDSAIFKMTNKSLWPRLETYMVYDRTVFFHPRPEAILPANTLSAENPIALVNVRDTERIRHFKDMYEACSLPSHLANDRVELLSSLLTAEGLEEYFDTMHQDATSMWAWKLHEDDNTIPQTVAFHKSLMLHPSKRTHKTLFPPYDRSHPWVRDVLMPRMPQFQWVVAFKLCQAPCHTAEKKRMR